jgi:hypothetical protein
MSCAVHGVRVCLLWACRELQQGITTTSSRHSHPHPSSGVGPASVVSPPPPHRRDSMADCLQALQECSLIGLEDSPQLLGRSMILGGVSVCQHALRWRGAIGWQAPTRVAPHTTAAAAVLLCPAHRGPSSVQLTSSSSRAHRSQTQAPTWALLTAAARAPGLQP